MDHYLDIEVMKDPEFSEEVLMSALFARFHRAICSRKGGDIALSFPRHHKTLGNLMRIHGRLDVLQQLEQNPWRAALSGYCNITPIQPVPQAVQWRVVSRVQVKSSPARQLRRSLRKGWLTEEQAKARLATALPQRTDLPFLNVKSLSNDQRFRLFVQHGPLQPQAVSGTFSHYGFSQTATIPWF